MIVDDSLVVRGIIRRILEEHPRIRVTITAANGQVAIDELKNKSVDVTILDIEMPVMDGITALPKLIAIAPHMSIIMASTLTQRNADISMKALSLGAADYIPKPSTTEEENNDLEVFGKTLISKVLALGEVTRSRKAPPPATTQPPMPVSTPSVSRPSPVSGTPADPTPSKFIPMAMVKAAPAVSTNLNTPKETSPYTLLPASSIKPEAIAIGSSTGGPQALLTLFGSIKGHIPQVPIFITQHMPAMFTKILADQLSTSTGRPCIEGKEGDKVKADHIYVAPGNFHMVIAQKYDGYYINLNQEAPENFCRPAADPMLRSLAKCYGNKLLAVILTGMGSDGAKGCRTVVDAGGSIISQDEASCVVWGMPRAIAEQGLSSAILPLMNIGPEITKRCRSI